MKRIILNKDCEVITSYNVVVEPHAEWSYEPFQPKPISKKSTGCLQPAAILGFMTVILLFAFAATVEKKESRKWQPIRISKEQKAYIQRFANTAQGEQKKFGIPASITLAQAILQSNNGTSELATKNNNHFEIKCFSKNCKVGHCTNYEDDNHKDFFRKYNSAWESFREHSQKLQNQAFAPCHKSKNPIEYANQLQRCKYATIDKYAEKLINIIEDCDLTYFDN